MTTASVMTVFAATLGASGFWTLIQALVSQKHQSDDLIKGLGHFRVLDECDKYIKRGWITPEEYDDFYRYLGTPYLHAKANGLARKAMEELDRLPRRTIDDMVTPVKED